jgi:hypothetical protein
MEVRKFGRFSLGKKDERSVCAAFDLLHGALSKFGGGGVHWFNARLYFPDILRILEGLKAAEIPNFLPL